MKLNKRIEAEKKPMIFYIAPDGDDRWSGELAEAAADVEDGPFATLERARDAVREAKECHGLPAGGIHVRLRGGIYWISRTFDLAVQDSGTETAPITYTACEGETVRLVGGRQLQSFTPVKDPSILARLPEEARNRVRQCDLRAEGIDDFGKVRPRGHSGGSAHAPLELFFNGRVMPYARWPKQPPLPNRGFVDIADFKDGRLHYDDDRPARWSSDAEVYLHGYYRCDWASSIVRVTGWDHATRSLTADPPNISGYGAGKGGRFYFFNVLDELSEPGEWCLDRRSGRLYFWPPSSLLRGEPIVSVLDGPLIRLRDVDHVRFDRLTLEGMRGDGVSIQGGTHVAIRGCMLRNIGRHGVEILDGFDHEVTGCDIFETGECGVDILAGDRKTLTPCRHRVHNCHFRHNAREGWTYFDSVRMAHNLEKGCGVIVTNNRMHEHRHALMHYKGNDHRIERNEMYNMTLEGDDCGSIYTGRCFAMQGNVIRHNYIHHVGDSGRNDWGSFGVYMDDCGGGTDISGNIFHFIDKAVLAGGGVNIRIHNNIFIECQPAIWFDERGASAGADGPNSMVHDTMRTNLEAVDAHQPDSPYAKYPNMDKVLRAFREHLGILTWGGGVYRNIVWGSRGAWLSTYWTTYPPHFEFHDNLVNEEPGFVDPDFDLYGLRPDSPALARIGFEPIPFDQIGLIRDEFRPQLAEARVRIEVLKPVGGLGEAGQARLIVRNTGDLLLKGEELVEFKTRRHGPGIDFVRVPYKVASGKTKSFEFDIELTPKQLEGQFELFLCSRGEYDLRPYWTRIPVSYSLDTALTLVKPLTAGADVPPARVRLAIQNVGSDPVKQDTEVRATPADGIHWRNSNTMKVVLEPGHSQEQDFQFQLTPTDGPLCSRVTIETHAVGIKPARLPLIVEYPLPYRPHALEVDGIARFLAAEPWLPVKGKAKNSQAAYYGDIRLGAAGEELVLWAKILDANPKATPMIWDGSAVEIYGCSPDRERIGHVFGAIPIGQVYLVPAVKDQPARGLQEKDNAQHLRPDIRIQSTPCEGGYEMQAAVPLELIGISPGADRFLMEIQVNTPENHGLIAAGRGNLFGSYTAFNDTQSYALMVIRR